MAALNAEGLGRPAAVAAARQAPVAAGPRGSQLWVDKHKPASSSQLVGNNTAVDTLRKWLREWDAVHLK